MSALVCPSCFWEFEPWELWFRCLEHAPPLEFQWDEGRIRRAGPAAACPKGGHMCGIRLCPKCKTGLPCHLGRARQLTVAITGPQGTGKTLYLWSLLHELRGRLATDPEPFVAAMFENEESFRSYRRTNKSIFEAGELPAGTQAKPQEKGNLPPLTVRLWSPRGLTTLSFYDPAGELIENLHKIEFLRYLRHATALIYLFQPPARPDPFALEAERDPAETCEAAAAGLGNIITHLRREMGLREQQAIPKTLAVVLTRADDGVFEKHSPQSVTPGYGWPQSNWRRWKARDRRAVGATSDACRALIRGLGYNNLVSNAEGNFCRCAFFAVSSVGDALRTESLDVHTIRPIGVEGPLFWCLNEAD